MPRPALRRQGGRDAHLNAQPKYAQITATLGAELSCAGFQMQE
jgi:hypothetical protein